MSDALPRRAFLGLGVRETEAGLAITRVLPGSIGERAALRVADHLVAIDGQPITTIEALTACMRRVVDRARLTIAFVREGERGAIEVPIVAFPREEIAGSVVRYEHVRVASGRLRTIVTAPDDAARNAAILFVPGLRYASIDFAGATEAPFARLVHGLAQRGLATMRVDRPGLGDSEGEGAIDLAAEVDAYARALEVLRADPAVDPDRVYVFGHSVGGMIAPLLASIRGAIVYGSTARRWSSCLRDGLARQLALRGTSEAGVAAQLARFDRDPFAETFGRTRAFHEELEHTDVAAAWERAGISALIVIGEHDWVVSEDEQRAIAEHVHRAEVAELDGLDHAFTRHATRAASLAALGRGAFDARLVEVCARWIDAQR